MRRFLLLSASFSSLLAFAACSAHDPHPMGRGYVSYGEAYKSSPGTPARDVGYEYSNEMNQDAVSSMRPAVQDLVEKLDRKLSFNIDKIYLKQPAYTAFYNTLDHLLRDELTKRGYVLSVEESGSVPVELFASGKLSPCFGDTVYLALAVDPKSKVPSDVVGGFYNIPKYDFKPAGDLKIDVPKCD